MLLMKTVLNCLCVWPPFKTMTKSVSWLATFLLLWTFTKGQGGEECLRQRVSFDNRVFMDEFGERQNCTPESFVYEARYCDCTSLIGGTPFADREPDVNITFYDGQVRDALNRVWINNTDVNVSASIDGSVDGYVGVFNGGQLEIPFFNATEMGAQLRIEIRFLETDLNNARTTALVANSDSLGGGSVFVGLNMAPEYSSTRLFLDTGVPSTVEARNPSGWKTLVVNYDAVNDNPSLELTIENDNGEIDSIFQQVTGNIVIQNHPLIIGAASSGEEPFIGYIDHIKIWKAGFY